MSGLDGDNKRPSNGSVKRARAFPVAAERLRLLRMTRGWTQREAAERAGVSDRLIRKAEAGEPIELSSIALLAQLYSTPENRLTLNDLLAVRLSEAVARSESAQIEAMIRRWYDELWNKGRLEVIEELAAPDAVLHAQGDDLLGHTAVRQRVAAMRSAFADFDFVIEQLAVNGNIATVRWRVHLTHVGSWMGEPASGRRIAIQGSSWIRVEGGLLQEGWDHWDQQQVIDQPGTR